MVDAEDGKGLPNRASQLSGNLKLVIEIVTSLVTIGTAITAFVTKVGGLQQFLIEVSTIGFAIYVAFFFFCIPTALLLEQLESRTRRQTTDIGLAVALSIAAVGGGVFLRFKIFAEGVTEDLDGIGTAFGVIVGVIILLLPLGVLWYYAGSRPDEQ